MFPLPVDCRQQAILLSLVPVALTTAEITGIFISRYSCCRYLNIPVKLTSAFKFQKLSQLQDLVILCVTKVTHL